jgi:hypothetical protein
MPTNVSLVFKLTTSLTDTLLKNSKNNRGNSFAKGVQLSLFTKTSSGVDF